jgi:hypothetical protein
MTASTTSTGLIPSRRILLYGKTIDVLFMEGSLPDAVTGGNTAEVDLTVARGGATQTFKRLFSGFLVSVHGYRQGEKVVVLPVPVSMVLPKPGQEIRMPRRDAHGLRRCAASRPAGSCAGRSTSMARR